MKYYEKPTDHQRMFALQGGSEQQPMDMNTSRKPSENSNKTTTTRAPQLNKPTCSYMLWVDRTTLAITLTDTQTGKQDDDDDTT